MTRSTEVAVTPAGQGSFRVEVRGHGTVTTHFVTVPEGLADELGWGEGGQLELVRESFAFLLEREPASSILGRFSLDVIGDYFPEYRAEIRRRVRP
jgi:bifunctional DNA-binding transcriptional regulator/antitoxin component of YhaV-PrlF toxin-antitoxin module